MVFSRIADGHDVGQAVVGPPADARPFRRDAFHHARNGEVFPRSNSSLVPRADLIFVQN